MTTRSTGGRRGLLGLVALLVALVGGLAAASGVRARARARARTAGTACRQACRRSCGGTGPRRGDDGHYYCVGNEPIYAAENPDFQRYGNHETGISGFVPNWVFEDGAYERLHPDKTLAVGEAVEVRVDMYERADDASPVVDTLGVVMWGPDEWDHDPSGPG